MVRSGHPQPSAQPVGSLGIKVRTAVAEGDRTGDGSTMQAGLQRTLTAGDTWTERAECRGAQATDFFARSLPDARAAIRVCERCEVKQECLDYAVDNDMDLGVWGGLTERQRRSYARRTRR